MAHNFLPNKFLCRYPLRTGTAVYAAIFAIVLLICVIVVLHQMCAYTSCLGCSYVMLKNAYAFSAVYLIICIFVLIINLIYLCKIRNIKSSCVLVWVVTTGIWLLQTFCLTLVLLSLSMWEVSLVHRIMSFIFGLLAFAIAFYGLLVGVGFYTQIKGGTIIAGAEA